MIVPVVGSRAKLEGRLEEVNEVGIVPLIDRVATRGSRGERYFGMAEYAATVTLSIAVASLMRDKNISK